MSSRTLDLRKVFGMIVTYNYKEQHPVSPTKPFTVTTELFPGGESAIHIHPHQIETYEVQKGEMQVLLNNEWKTVSAGEKITIPKGTVHAFKNESSEVVVAINSHDPGLRFGEMLETIQTYISQKKITSTKGFKNLCYMAGIMVEYDDVMLTVKPSNSLIRMMAKTGRMLGFK